MVKLIKAILDVVILIFSPGKAKLREEVNRLSSYKKACVYAQEYILRDELISQTKNTKKIAAYKRQKKTLRRKFYKTVTKN